MTILSSTCTKLFVMMGLTLVMKHVVKSVWEDKGKAVQVTEDILTPYLIEAVGDTIYTL